MLFNILLDVVDAVMGHAWRQREIAGHTAVQKDEELFQKGTGEFLGKGMSAAVFFFYLQQQPFHRLPVFINGNAMAEIFRTVFKNRGEQGVGNVLFQRL